MADVNDSSKNKLIGEDDARQHDSSSENEMKAPKVEYDEVTWTRVSILRVKAEST